MSEPSKFKLFLSDIGEAMGLAYAVFFERGALFFKFPLLVCLGGAFIIYLKLCTPIIRLCDRELGEIKALGVQAANASDYQTYKSAVLAHEKHLPDINVKDDWLTNKIWEACKAEDIVPNAISSQAESNEEDFILVRVDLTAKISFHKLGLLVARLESNPLFIHVETLNLRKDAENIGQALVDIKIGTMFAKQRAEDLSKKGVKLR
ncbi:MAG: hypothetical protein NTW04_02260 [Elusimicrobia bacterium]|nr:hypothetical protein [Elusimicrobiota bacterium]